MTELVTDYLEGALPLRRRLAARLHLLLCDACSRYFDQMRRTIRLLQQAPPLAPSPQQEDRLVQVLRSSRPPA